MASQSSVPPIEFTATGLMVPTDAQILAGVQADINAAFGGNINPAPTTPQGILAASYTASISANYALFAQFVNQVDPDFAEDFMQDAIGRIYFQNRNAGLPTAVQCQCIGAQGTLIPVGAMAVDTSGNLYTCTQSGTIDASGVVILSFAAIVNGPTPCPANTLTRIYKTIPGWDTINNTADGIVGADVESRADFAFRRTQSVAKNAKGSLPSVYGSVFDVPGVIDVYVSENKTGAPVNVGSTGYTLAPHSLYVGVAGGAAADIANAIWVKKAEGCDLNGDTSYTITDNSGYAYPQPTYVMTWKTLNPQAMKFLVQIASDPNLPVNVVALVQAAVAGAFVGADGGLRARVGALLLASRYYAPIAGAVPNASVLSILLGPVSPTLTSYLVGIDNEPTLNATDISVVFV